MRATNHRPVTVLLSIVVLVAGCSSSVASLAPGPSTPSSLGAASATPTPAATPSPRPTASPMPTPTASSVMVDTVAVTLVDGLRVRSKPRVSDDSFKYEPPLPLGTQLYVLDGPVSASDYTWYEVVPLASRAHPRGWVASASRDGEPWLGAGDFACPPLPSDLHSLAALPSGVGLACFPRVPITVTARLVGCYCDMDGSWYTPGWFFLGSGGPNLLVEPGVTRPPDDTRDWFHIDLDPTGQHPDVLPVGKVVQVTGAFDHPAAANCTVTEMDGQPVSTQDCRLEFAVTRLITVGP
jgi:hypothetical protein